MKQITYIITILLLLLTAGCRDDYGWEGTETPGTESPQGNLSFSVQLPGVRTQATYAIGEMDENKVKDVDVLIFAVADDNSTEVLEARCKGKGITQPVDNPANEVYNLNFSIDYEDAPGTAQRKRFVVLANVREQLDDLIDRYNGGIGLGKTLFTQLVYENIYGKDNQNRWHATSPSDYTPLPMWGESSVFLVDKKTTSVGNIVLMRSLSSIEVNVNSDTELRKNFKLKSVYVYNSKTRGWIVPDAMNIKLNEAGKPSVTAPSVNFGMDDNFTLPYNYTGPAGYSAPGYTSLTNSIYMFESYGAAKDKPLETTCLVIGGYYGEGNTTKESFYRLDFKSGDTRYADLLRNHKYIVNITGVKGEGHGTVDDAFRSTKVTLEANILDWDQGEISDVTMGGSNKLAVSQSYFKFSSEARNPQILVFTAVAEGWTARVDEDSPWITIDGASSGAADVNTFLKMNLTTNTGQTIRRGKVYVTAGRMTKVINIVQGDRVYAWDNVEDEIIVDGAYNLNVDKSYFQLTREGGEVEVLTFTNVPEGWTATVEAPYDSWLSIVNNDNKGAANVSKALGIKIAVNNTDTRIGYVKITAGRMSKLISIRQTTKVYGWDEDSNDISMDVYVLGISKMSHQLSKTAQSQSVLVTADHPEGWTATVTEGAPWLNIQTASGAAGQKKELKFSVTANPTEERRIGKISVTSGRITRLITVTQSNRVLSWNEEESEVNDGLSELNVSSYVSIPADYLSHYIDILATGGDTWTASFENGTSSWCRILSTSSSNRNNILGINAKENTTGIVRSERIKITSGRISTYIVIEQSTQKAPKSNNEYYPSAHNGWAGSNIYWDGSKLTFDDVGVTTHKDYQGLYFQWGSLTGTSPNSNNQSGIYLYKPDGTVEKIDQLSYNKYNGVGEWATYFRKNLKGTPSSSQDEKKRAYLYEITDGKKGVGDICKYMTEKGWAPKGKRWRMPTSAEVINKNAQAVGVFAGTATGGIKATNSVTGTFQVDAGFNYNNMFYPANGYYTPQSNYVTDLKNGLYLWSSSPSTKSHSSNPILYAYYVYCWGPTGTNAFGANSEENIDYAMPVRCVVE